VEGHGGNGQAVFLPQFTDFNQIDEAVHLFFYMMEATEGIQLLEEYL
jgi:hypothetical protein